MTNPICPVCNQEQELIEITSYYADSNYEWQCLNPKCPGDKND